MTIRLLVEGHSDPASAKRLGVSTRTYAGYIAALKDEYGVQTRFQLGYAMSADPHAGSAGRRTRPWTGPSTTRWTTPRATRPSSAEPPHPHSPRGRPPSAPDCPRNAARAAT